MTNAPVSPLDVLLTAMQRKWEAGDLDAAAALARAAAPYLHPRHAPMKEAARGPAAPERLTDAQLDRLLEQGCEEPLDHGRENGGCAGGEGAP